MSIYIYIYIYIYINSNIKSVKISEINSKKIWILNIIDIKSVITEHPKTSYKLSKTTRLAEKVDSNSSLYSDTEKWKFFK